ncbi:MAG: hypothetical protein HKP61_20340 [Dactylosporangium sp.]|nr:hypothetical protein [Dactylosporangium sp.]NNJ63234.1 hypothetical protein [Dactylosporangium sp.]
MARLRARLARAALLHQQAVAAAGAAARLVRDHSPIGAATDQHAEQRALAARLRALATKLAPGWLHAPLDAMPPTAPLGGVTLPTFVGVGHAHPLDDTSFPVLVPLLRAGHVAIDGDARDPRVAGLLRALALRLLTATPPGSLRIQVVDCADAGTTLAPFSDALSAPVVTEQRGFRTLLAEAERWIAVRSDAGVPAMLLIIASLPELTDGTDLARIAALAKAGPAGRLHIIAAGWPPPPLTAETTQRPLPHCTQIALRNPYAWVGDPPGATFSANRTGPGRLNAPIELDRDPPLALVRRVCEQLQATPEPESPAGTPWLPVPDEPAPSAWRDYVLAAQRLDSVRQESTAIVAEHAAVHAAVAEDLAGLRARLAEQATRLGDTAAAAGLPPPPLSPGHSLACAGWEALGRANALPGTVASAIRGAHALIGEADSALADDARSHWWSLWGFVAMAAAVATALLAGTGAIVLITREGGP